MPGSEKQNSMFKPSTSYIQKNNPFPVTSCGVILFKINDEYVKNDLKDGRYKYLLIQRKDTLGYVELKSLWYTFAKFRAFFALPLGPIGK